MNPVLPWHTGGLSPNVGRPKKGQNSYKGYMEFMARRIYKRKPLNERRVESFIVLLKPSEKKQLEAMAERKNKTMSAVAREIIFDVIDEV